MKPTILCILTIAAALAQNTGKQNPLRHLTLMNRQGKVMKQFGPQAQYQQPAFSPDGRRLAIVKDDDVWVFEIASGEGKPLVTDPGQERAPGWSPDGKYIAYYSNRNGSRFLYQIPSDGSGKEELKYTETADAPLGMTEWSRDGKWWVYFGGNANSATKGDVWGLSTKPGQKPVALIRTPANEVAVRMSPDGRYVSYRSDESGREEIYVAVLDPSRAASPEKWKISTNGGSMVRWKNGSRELYYLAPDGQMMEVAFAPGPAPKIGTPKPLFRVPVDFPITGFTGGASDISWDGSLFVFVVPTGR